jgi:hypothetical protein
MKEYLYGEARSAWALHKKTFPRSSKRGLAGNAGKNPRRARLCAAGVSFEI